jgi:hypothetical protein
MSLSLLLDENLSEKLLPLLFDRFPDSRHVRLIKAWLLTNVFPPEIF